MYVDLNTRNGRRMLKLKFGDASAATTQTAGVRSTRTKEASMSKLEGLYLHPGALWCSTRIVEVIQEPGLKVGACDTGLKNVVTVVLGPEEFEAEIEIWGVYHNPP